MNLLRFILSIDKPPNLNFHGPVRWYFVDDNTNKGEDFEIFWFSNAMEKVKTFGLLEL